MATPVLPFDDAPAEGAASQLAVVPSTPGSRQLAIVTATPGTPGSRPPGTPGSQASKKISYDPRTDDTSTWASKGGKPEKMSWRLWFVGLGLLAMAGIDNILAYITFFTVRAFHGRLYNIVDLHFTLLPSIDIVLLGFAGLGTLTFVAMIIIVECLKLPMWHELMNFRLFFSALPSGIVCGILLYYSEKTQWAPFATVVAVFCTIFVWCLHMRVIYTNSLNVVSKISLDVSWFLALLCVVVLAVLYAINELKILTNSEAVGCPYAPNDRMPVLALPLERWYCAPWDKQSPMPISRAPIESEPVQLTCSQSFLQAFGLSIEPHLIECPRGCLRTFDPLQGNNVVGCGVYAVDSPLCVAAIHAGKLTDSGGQATVYGRVGVSRFQRCSRNSVTSVERSVTQTGGSVTVSQPGTGGGSSPFLAGGGRRMAVTVPSVLSNGKQVPQAFHFNNDQPGGLPQTKEFIWLKSYEEVPSSDSGIQASKPWTRIEATVSLRFAGIELSDEKIRLGEQPRRELFVKPHAGQVFDVKPPECHISESGVACQGVGSAVVQLDFCRTQVKQCPDS